MDEIEYSPGVNYKNALDILNGTINNIYTLLEMLQKRILDVEIKLLEIEEND